MNVQINKKSRNASPWSGVSYPLVFQSSDGSTVGVATSRTGGYVLGARTVAPETDSGTWEENGYIPVPKGQPVDITLSN